MRVRVTEIVGTPRQFRAIPGLARVLRHTVHEGSAADTWSGQPKVRRRGPAPVLYDLAIERDGKIVVGGGFRRVAGQRRKHIARLNPDGTLDASFDARVGQLLDPDPLVHVAALALQADGNIVVGGSFSRVNGQSRKGIARLGPDGTLDPSFTPGTDDPIGLLSLQADGKILLGGGFKQLRGTIPRLNPDGTRDADFNLSADGAITALVRQTDGKVLVGGVHGPRPPRYSYIARYNADGRLDTNFDGQTRGDLSDVVVQTDDKLVLGGMFRIQDNFQTGIYRLNPDGTHDMAFNPVTDDFVDELALQTDGKILLAGLFSKVNGQGRQGIARLNPDGTLDLSFTATIDNQNAIGIIRLAVQTEGKILLGGQLKRVNGQSCGMIARLNADGTLDESFSLTGAYCHVMR